MVRDPVCGKEIDIEKFTEQSEYKDRIYYFCSTECKTKFDKDPREYEVKVIIKKRKG